MLHDSGLQLKRTTAYAKELSDAYKEISYLQFEFMDKHEKIADNVYRVTYSDGSYITFDYNNNTFKLTKNDITIGISIGINLFILISP